MNHPNRRQALVALSPLLPSLLSTTAYAQAAAWPSRPVRLILPVGPGGGSDALSRLLAQKLQDVWQQPVVVEYKPGANTILATDYVAKQPADGYTLGVALTAYMINPGLQASLPYDTVKDLAGLSMLATSDFGMFAHPSLEANTIPELIAYAKRNPGKLSYATGGVGSGSHLVWEMFNMMAGVELVHVPYSRGGGAAQLDVIAGRVPLLIDVAFGQMPAAREGRLKAIALASPKRSAHYPDVPLIAETLPGFSTLSIMGVFCAAGVPHEIQKRISTDVAAAVRSSEVHARMVEMGLDPVGSSAEEYTRKVRSEIDQWTHVIRTANIKVK